MVYPKSLQELIENLQVLPSVGQKTAERFALRIIDLDSDVVSELSNSIINAKNNTKYCQICGNLSETNFCSICEDEKRDSSLICVVESVSDVIAMEKTENYHGLYHVLNGLISPSKGILPDDLNIKDLEKRLADPKLAEIIIATNLTIEGDTTSLYLSKLINQVGEGKIAVSRIAHGLPVGGHLGYADDLTIIKAMEGRNKI
ncbi:MAG: recombination protein RecR [Erysipelothrix sp.]|nr:recombination protein RecR [Erysipelothrix sp.]